MGATNPTFCCYLYSVYTSCCIRLELSTGLLEQNDSDAIIEDAEDEFSYLTTKHCVVLCKHV